MDASNFTSHSCNIFSVIEPTRIPGRNELIEKLMRRDHMGYVDIDKNSTGLRMGVDTSR
jgi:hypothetical protein